MEVKPLICPQCGGTVNRAKWQCEYCGTYFEAPKYEGETLKIIKCDARIDTFQAMYEIPNEVFYYGNEKSVEEMVKRNLAYKLAKGIVERMEIHRFENLALRTQEYRAKIRLVNPDFRF